MMLGLSVFCSLLNLFAVAVLLCSSGSTGYDNISPTPAVSDSEGPIGVFPIGNPSNAHTPAPQPSVLLPLPASPPINSAPVPQSIKGLAPSQSPVSKSYVLPPSSAHESTPSLAPSAPRRGRLKPDIPVSVVSPSSKPPQKAPKTSAKHGSTPQDSERNKLPPVKPPISSTTAPAPKETIHSSPPTGQPVAPGVQPFIFPAPVAPPPSQMLQNPLTNHPTIPEEPPSVLPAPPPSMNRSKTDIPIPAPPNEIPGQYPPLNSSPKEAPSANNTLRHASNVPPPLASPKSSPSIRSQSPLSSLPTSVYKHYHGKENVPSPAPLPFSHSPPASGKQGPIVSVTPSYSPKSYPKSGHKHDGSPYVDTDFPPAPPFPSQRSPLSHHHSASSPPPSAQITFPSLSPNNSPASPTSKPKVQVLPRIRSLPPPPLNQDCQDLTCAEPLTNTPPGSPCGCVWPMQVELRLSVALYTFFPLVAKFAEEIAAGVFMKQSQIRIMGANAASQDSEKTTVLLDLVPLGDKFDNTTAYLTFQRFWQKLVPINASFFGSYEVLYVHYPGLPPSPPSSINVVAGQPFSDHGNNGRTIQPLGVDVRKGKHKKGLSGGIIAIAVLSASATILLCGAVAWVLLVKRGDDQPELSTTATVPSLSKPSGVAASIFGGGPSSASLSFGSSMATYTGSAKTFSSSDIQRATDSFNASRIIGEGGFGRVYSGVLEDGTEVAVKVLKRDDQHGSREFLAEVEMLSRLHHRNLVKLIGICTEERSRCLVYELISNGSLESHLYGKGIEKTTSLDWSTRLKIALGAARGLAYLHEDSSPRVIHRDFKSSNILLEHDFTPKVSDFGLARTALDEENRHVSTRVMGTFGYVAPEYAMTGHLLVKSDVYSYGVVLLELLTGRKPVDMSQPPGEENLVAWARPLLTSKEALESIIDSSLGPDFPFDSIAKVAAIASMCVQPEVSHRPFMGEVVQALKLVVSDESDETKEFGSRCCSQEDLSIEMNDGNGANTSSDQMRYHMQNHSPLSDYDAERGLSISDFFVSARVGRADSGSFRMYSSSGPLRSGKGKQLWQKMRRLSH